MKINELQEKTKVPELKVKITKIHEEETTARGATVRAADVEDETGQTILKLWNDQTTMFEEGDEVIIKGGFCKMFKDEFEVTSGKFGSINKV